MRTADQKSIIDCAGTQRQMEPYGNMEAKRLTYLGWAERQWIASAKLTSLSARPEIGHEFRTKL